MKRRQAIKQLAITSAAVLTLPAWAKAWSLSSLPPLNSPMAERDLLNAVLGAILPESPEFPGAVSLGVPDFVERMLADCYTKEVSDNVKTGLRFADSVARRTYRKSFTTLPVEAQQAILLQFEGGNDPAMQDCYKVLKQLTIQGYNNSEYVQTKFLEYEMAPGYYRGCVPYVHN